MNDKKVIHFFYVFFIGYNVSKKKERGDKMERNIEFMPSNPMYAFAYVPYQRFENLYSANEALWHGTLFKDLYMPFSCYANNPIMNPFK